MNRVLAVAVTAATATMVASAAIVPAMAAQRPADARTAATVPAKKSTVPAKKSTVPAKKSGAKTAAQHAAASVLAPLLVTSQLDNGQYVTVVQCHGSVKTPPPVEVGQPDAPLTVHGSSLPAGILATLKNPNAYKAVYACTVVVKERVPAKPKPKPRTAGHRSCVVVSGSSSGGSKSGNRCKKVTLNTGFGGMAGQVSRHHPAS